MSILIYAALDRVIARRSAIDPLRGRDNYAFAAGYIGGY